MFASLLLADDCSLHIFERFVFKMPVTWSAVTAALSHLQYCDAKLTAQKTDLALKLMIERLHKDSNITLLELLQRNLRTIDHMSAAAHYLLYTSVMSNFIKLPTYLHANLLAHANSALPVNKTLTAAMHNNTLIPTETLVMLQQVVHQEIIMLTMAHEGRISIMVDLKVDDSNILGGCIARAYIVARDRDVAVPNFIHLATRCYTEEQVRNGTFRQIVGMPYIHFVCKYDCGDLAKDLPIAVYEELDDDGCNAFIVLFESAEPEYSAMTQFEIMTTLHAYGVCMHDIDRKKTTAVKQYMADHAGHLGASAMTFFPYFAHCGLNFVYINPDGCNWTARDFDSFDPVVTSLASTLMRPNTLPWGV
ncbi:hypothetical protein JKY72_01620 [Candidatus Gracilibacteria bacterium]|nr:hypothetical protein [Candidatus Gracilibacteria bacterium]